MDYPHSYPFSMVLFCPFMRQYWETFWILLIWNKFVEKKKSKISRNMHNTSVNITYTESLLSCSWWKCCKKITHDIKLGQLPGALLLGWSENYSNLSVFTWDRIQILFFFHVLGFLLKVCQSVLRYVLLVFSPYKVLGKKRTIQILVSMSIFLVLNLHTCSTDLETWYLKASSVPKDNLTNRHCSFSPETENLLNIITWLWMRATCTFHRCSFFCVTKDKLSL